MKVMPGSLIRKLILVQGYHLHGRENLIVHQLSMSLLCESMVKGTIPTTYVYDDTSTCGFPVIQNVHRTMAAEWPSEC